MWTNTEKELIEGIIKHGPEILEHCACSDDISKYLSRLQDEHLHYPKPTEIDISKWFMPNDYCPNLVEYLYGCCQTQEQKDRVSLELDLYIKNGMMDMLFFIKYLVDTLRKNKVIWGVGRGSSVASYVLYLIGVHKVDSIKYNLPIEEFFKGDQNG